MQKQELFARIGELTVRFATLEIESRKAARQNPRPLQQTGNIV